MEPRSPLFILLGVLLLLAAGAAFYFFARGAGEKSLEQSGVAARAKVLEIAKTGVNRGPNTPLVHFRLEVTPPGGAAYVVELEQGIQVMDLPRVQPGAEVAVRIDPRDPSHLVLVP